MTFQKIIMAILAINLIGLPLIVHTARAQSPEQMQVDVSVRDHYLNTVLDSVQISLFFDGILLDSTVTGADGRAVLIVRVTSMEPAVEVPQEFTISANYPNPFLTETRVDVGVPESQSVRLEIFNVLGQRVVAQQLYMEAGSYSVDLSMGHLPVGVYFLRIGGRDAKVEKMIKMSRTYASTSPVFSVGPSTGRTGHIARPADVAKGASLTATSDGGYLLRAVRSRYQPFEISPGLEENQSNLLIEMKRNNLVSIVTLDPANEPVSRQVRVIGEQFNRIIRTPDTLVMDSGIYTVASTTDSLFTVNDIFEVISRDSAYVIHPFIPQEAEITGRVSNEQQEFVSGTRLIVYRDGVQQTSTTTAGDGTFSITLLADGSVYSLVIYPDTPLNGTFDPESFVTFSPDARVIVPEPGGSYKMDFVLHAEPPLYLPGGGTDLPAGNYTLATDGGTVMVSNIPPDLGIVGGSARAYSPTSSPEIFPGEFATREEGVESGLISGGFASINLLRSDGNGGMEPIRELRDSTGAPVQVELRFRIDPADYIVIRDPATLSDLPGYINRPDTIDAPLYYYDESQGDWLLSPQFGWLENEHGAIPMSELAAIQQGEYQGAIYMTGLVDHFTWYNLDYPSRDACVTGRLMDQAALPISNRLLSLLSMPEDINNSFFSNIIDRWTNDNGFFQARVPRTERGTGDDWNANNRLDRFRFFIQYDDSQPCDVFVFDNDGEGIMTPNFPEEEGCANLGTIRVTPFEAKKVKFNITFLDIEREDRPDYPLFVSPPSFTGFNYTKATLRDQRVPFMRDAWNCVCQTEINAQECNFESSTNTNGRAEFTLPVFQSRPAYGLRGTLSYRKDRPDIAEGAYEFADCNYQLDPSVNILASTVNQTVRCEVDRRGPPDVEIIRIATDAAFNQGVAFQTQFLFDDLVTIEAEGEDLNEGPVNIFYWTDTLQTRLVANGRSVTRQASNLFGTGQDRSIKANGIDYYGWRGTNKAFGINVQEVDVQIQASRERIAMGDTALIRSQVTGANNTGITWSVNDPSIATIDENGVLAAHNPGEVTVTGRSQADPTVADQVVVEVASLRAVFAVNPPAGDSTTVFTFDGSLSIGNIILYEWDFGDSTTATGQVVQHIYSTGGQFDARLTVRDQDGLVAHTVQTVSTTGRPLVVIQADPVSGSPPLQVNFDGSGSFAVTGDIIRWDWDFGDGNTAEGETTQHTYTDPGEYMSALTVEDAAGQTDTDSIEITVHAGTIAQFSVIPQSGVPPLEVTVDASETQGNIIRYSWDFGDGTAIPNGLPVENHTYINAGVYEITLEIEDVSGKTDVARKTVSANCDNLIFANISITRVEDLDQLSNVCGIFGDLSIQTEDLVDLDGLSALRKINGTIQILSNTNLVSMEGLANLMEAGSIIIRNNPVLSEIVGFEHTIIKNRITIEQNPALERISGFNQIGELEAALSITQNNLLVSIDGFRNLTDVGYIHFSNNASLVDLSILENLRIVQGNFEIDNHPSLLSLGTLNNLEVIGRSLQISDGPLLTDWAGFRSLSRIERDFNVSGTGISHCELAEFANTLRQMNGIGRNINLWRNADELNQNVTITNASHMSQLTDICFVNGNVAINGTNFQNLSGLDSLRTIGGTLTVISNPSMASLAGLHNILEVMSGIILHSNAVMEDLSALSRITNLSGINLGLVPISNLSDLSSLRSLGSLTISSVAQITNLNGLENLEVLNSLNLSALENFTSIDGIQHLEEIPGDVTLSSLSNLNDGIRFSELRKVGRLTLGRLDGLTDVSLFETLEEVASVSGIPSSISLSQMSGLQSLNGLENLHTIGAISINSAPELASLEGLTSLTDINSINITGAGKLADMTGLENLKTVESLTLRSNPMLSGLTGLSGLVGLNHITLSNNQILTHLQGFPENLETEFSIDISDNAALQDLSGLESITSLRSLMLQNNSSLESLGGLENLGTITQTGITIRNHPQLQNLDALSSLESLSGGSMAHLSLDNLPLVGSLEPLAGVSAESVFSILVRNLHSLKHLHGLEEMADIDFVEVSNNDSLETMQGLNNLRNVRNLYIGSNPTLKHLDDLNGVFHVSAFFTVTGNASLERVSGMATLNRVQNMLTMTGNVMLPTCDAEALANQVQNRGGYGFLSISNNNDDGVCLP